MNCSTSRSSSGVIALAVRPFPSFATKCLRLLGRERATVARERRVVDARRLLMPYYLRVPLPPECANRQFVHQLGIATHPAREVPPLDFTGAQAVLPRLHRFDVFA